MFEIIALKLTT